MKAKIDYLKGKYYGTLIGIDTGGGITVWITEGNPSQRQLNEWDMTLEEAKADGMLCDAHYETDASYQIACKIRDIINEASAK